MADLNQNTNTDFNQILLMIQEAKARVYAKANAESILLNFNVGKIVSEKVALGNWGDHTVQENILRLNYLVFLALIAEDFTG